MRDVEKISLPNSLKRIGYKAFNSYGNVKANYYDHGFYFGNEDNPYVYLAYTSKDLAEIQLHDDCKVISDKSFDDSRYSLTEVVLSKDISYIPPYAFGVEDWNNPTQLVKLNVSDSKCDIEEIDDYAFKNTSLEEITFTEGLHRIGREAFCDCRYLTKLNWPGFVNDLSIGDRAFMMNKNDSYAAIPDGTIKVGYNAFTINVDKKSLINIPASLVEAINVEEFGPSGGFIDFMHDSDKDVVKPLFIFEDGLDNHVEKVNSLLENFENPYGEMLKYNYYEHFSFSRGYLYKKNGESQIYCGILNDYSFYASQPIIPNVINGLPVETVELFRKISGRSYNTLNENCKHLIINKNTYNDIVAYENLTTITLDNVGANTYRIFSYAEEEDFKVEGLPQNVSVYFYSKEENKDGKHWHMNSVPIIW